MERVYVALQRIEDIVVDNVKYDAARDQPASMLKDKAERHTPRSGNSGGVQYSMKTLLEAIHLSGMIRDANKIETVIKVGDKCDVKFW